MIPATSIAFQGDGTAWWTPADCTDDRPCAMLPETPCVTHARHFDRPCDTCGHQTDPDLFCTLCINGRHTFALNVERYDLECARCGASSSLPLGMSCADHRPVMGMETLRVSIVPGMVLPIVDAATWSEEPYVAVVMDHRGATVFGPDDGGDQVDGTDIDAPPDAKPGGWLVQLRVQR